MVPSTCWFCKNASSSCGGHRDFQSYFKVRPESLGNVGQNLGPSRQLLRRQYMKLWWWNQDIGDTRPAEYLQRKATVRELSQFNFNALWPGLPKYTGAYNTICPGYIELQDLMFALLAFGFALIWSFIAFIQCLSFEIGMFTQCHCVLKVWNILFWFYRSSQLRVCLESYKRLWIGTFGQWWNC
jgi:hypothetical protein